MAWRARRLTQVTSDHERRMMGAGRLRCNFWQRRTVRLNAIRNGNPICTLQMATNRAGAHSLRGPLVLALFTVAPGCGGAAAGTWP